MVHGQPVWYRAVCLRICNSVRPLALPAVYSACPVPVFIDIQEPVPTPSFWVEFPLRGLHWFPHFLATATYPARRSGLNPVQCCSVPFG